jgi:hypothetical protein
MVISPGLDFRYTVYNLGYIEAFISPFQENEWDNNSHKLYELFCLVYYINKFKITPLFRKVIFQSVS